VKRKLPPLVEKGPVWKKAGSRKKVINRSLWGGGGGGGGVRRRLITIPSLGKPLAKGTNRPTVFFPPEGERCIIEKGRPQQRKKKRAFVFSGKGTNPEKKRGGTLFREGNPQRRASSTLERKNTHSTCMSATLIRGRKVSGKEGDLSHLLIEVAYGKGKTGCLGKKYPFSFKKVLVLNKRKKNKSFGLSRRRSKECEGRGVSPSVKIRERRKQNSDF